MDVAETIQSNLSYVAHPLRIQRRRIKGFRLPDGTICVTRPGKWGNPFSIKTCCDIGYANDMSDARRVCVDCFRDWLLKGDLSEWWFDAAGDRWKWMRANLKLLYGKQLACYCSLDQPCHADVLAELAND